MTTLDELVDRLGDVRQRIATDLSHDERDAARAEAAELRTEIGRRLAVLRDAGFTETGMSVTAVVDGRRGDSWIFRSACGCAFGLTDITSAALNSEAAAWRRMYDTAAERRTAKASGVTATREAWEDYSKAGVYEQLGGKHACSTPSNREDQKGSP